VFVIWTGGSNCEFIWISSLVLMRRSRNAAQCGWKQSSDKLFGVEKKTLDLRFQGRGDVCSGGSNLVLNPVLKFWSRTWAGSSVSNCRSSHRSEDKHECVGGFHAESLPAHPGPNQLQTRLLLHCQAAGLQIRTPGLTGPPAVGSTCSCRHLSVCVCVCVCVSC